MTDFTGKVASELTPEEVREILAAIQEHTPGGYVWRISIDSDDWAYVILRRDVWWHLFAARWRNPCGYLDSDTSAESFTRKIYIGAWNLLVKREEALATPDWRKLAAEIQKLLNKKETD